MTSKKTSLAGAMTSASNPAKTAIETKLVPPTTERPPSRQGKKAISGFFDPAVSKQIKQLALDEDSTVQALLAEALNDLFVKYNHKPIA